jgi:hypothetical protein
VKREIGREEGENRVIRRDNILVGGSLGLFSLSIG